MTQLSWGPPQQLSARVLFAAQLLRDVVVPAVLFLLAVRLAYAQSPVFGRAYVGLPFRPATELVKRGFKYYWEKHLFLLSLCCNKSFGFRRN